MPRTKLASAADFVPEHATARTLREAVQACRGCDLYAHATQAVFGEGPISARIVFIGEQPGDEEDRRGHPFVGPSGKLLDRALADAGIDRSLAYVTNAVKHFKFEERGKRRLHKKPSGLEIAACRPWLEAEMHLIQPQILVCLGATAAQSIFGSAYRVTKERGRFVQNAWAPHVMSTVHPSAILRMPDEEQRHGEYERFVGDLKKVQRLWESLKK
ncbi:MAG TPA: UdgX family uracil-DNA binding protein [Bryobacteraceae bacterium]|nr:UdgX family uracil-DNA binding protein [Bryobacteraceae bacterium]